MTRTGYGPDSCSGKRRFDSQAAAKWVLPHISASGMRVYHCLECGGMAHSGPSGRRPE